MMMILHNCKSIFSNFFSMRLPVIKKKYLKKDDFKYNFLESFYYKSKIPKETSFVFKGNNFDVINPPNNWIGSIIKNNLNINDQKIITLVRDPIARNISAFFQNLNLYVDSSNNLDFIEIEKLRTHFLNDFDRHNRSLTWFDDEFKKTLNFDIYSIPFPKKKGYEIIKMKNIDLLILKLEIDDSIKESAIIEFLNLRSNFKLKRVNVADKKNYSKLYYRFKKEVSLPEEYVNKFLYSKYTKHFYTNREINEMRKKWL